MTFYAITKAIYIPIQKSCRAAMGFDSSQQQVLFAMDFQHSQCSLRKVDIASYSNCDRFLISILVHHHRDHTYAQPRHNLPHASLTK